jgi:DNA-binding MarR family transcriptional regulator
MYAPKAMDSLRRIVRGLRTTHAVARAHSISAAQLFVLRQIFAVPGLALADVARLAMTSTSSASEVTTRLVSAGFVERHVVPTDHRRVEFRITRAGERAIADMPSSVQERLLAGFKLLDERDQRDLARALEAWVAASGLASLPATMFFESPHSERDVEHDAMGSSS